MEELSRPTGVTVLSVLAILSGLIVTAGGISQLTASALYQSSEEGLLGFSVLVFGIFALAVGVGFTQGSSWSRKCGFVLAIVLVLVSALRVDFGAGSPVSLSLSLGLGIGYALPFSIVMLYFLTRYDVAFYLARDS